MSFFFFTNINCRFTAFKWGFHATEIKLIKSSFKYRYFSPKYLRRIIRKIFPFKVVLCNFSCFTVQNFLEYFLLDFGNFVVFIECFNDPGNSFSLSFLNQLLQQNYHHFLLFRTKFCNNLEMLRIWVPLGQSSTKFSHSIFNKSVKRFYH